jgi:hypothetical protein
VSAAMSNLSAPPALRIADAGPGAPIPEQLDALRCLASGPRAVVPLADVPAMLSLDPDVAAAVIHELVVLDLLSVWELDDSPVAIVSSRGADWLGLELSQVRRAVGHCWVWRAAGEGSIDPGPRPDVALCETDCSGPDPLFPLLDNRVDPGSPDPAMAAEAADELATPEGRVRTLQSHKRGGTVPRPRHLVGLSCPWPVATTPVCGGCRGLKLAYLEYCVCCDAYGAEALLSMIEPDLRQDPKPKDKARRQVPGRVAPLDAGDLADGVPLVGGLGEVLTAAAARLKALTMEYRRPTPPKPRKKPAPSVGARP